MEKKKLRYLVKLETTTTEKEKTEGVGSLSLEFGRGDTS